MALERFFPAKLDSKLTHPETVAGGYAKVMSAVLEDPTEITMQDLETEIHAYEAFYGIETAVLIQWIDNVDVRVAEIEDAGFWRSSHDLLKRLREAPARPETNDEDPSRVLVLALCLAV